MNFRGGKKTKKKRVKSYKKAGNKLSKTRNINNLITRRQLLRKLSHTKRISMSKFIKRNYSRNSRRR
tara:strand:+ start:4493 stop:4693 length:201 start_codon:yes stop_codon:yes gene_type:complete